MAPPVLASLAEDPACDGSWRSCEAVMAGDRSRDVALQAQDVVVVLASGAKVAAYGFLDVLKSILKFSLIAF